jgi:thioredoxin 1
MLKAETATRGALQVGGSIPAQPAIDESPGKIMKPTIEITEVNFEAEVLKSNQLVLVDFWAEWCGPCKMLAPVLDEVVNEQGDRVKVVKVDVDKNPTLANRFGIRSIPALLYFTGGKLRHQTIGVTSKKQIVETLDSLAVAA